LQTVFDKSKLLIVLQDFHALTGLRAVVFNSLGNDILSYPNDLPEFCSLIRNSSKGKQNCLLCDKKACDNAKATGKAIIYPCHAGLLEMITPIQVQGATVGYLLLSHIVKGEDEQEEWRQVSLCCDSYNIEMEKLKQAFNKLPRTNDRILQASADLLSLCAASLYQQRLARLAPESIQSKLANFITEHLSEDLSCNRLCRQLSISRTTLYTISYEIYGCGISEHISRLRIEKAKKLLLETDLPIKEICKLVGFNDYNYFYRVFRRNTGTTTNQYRKLFSNH
jgi:ligand-binding sensor protein